MSQPPRCLSRWLSTLRGYIFCQFHSLYKGKDYLIFFLTGTSNRWVLGFWGRKLSYPGKIFRTLVKKGRSAEANLAPLFQKSQKNVAPLISLKHNSHPWALLDTTVDTMVLIRRLQYLTANLVHPVLSLDRLELALLVSLGIWHLNWKIRCHN